MGQAIAKLMGITVAVVFLAFLVVLAARQVGSVQDVKAPAHAWFKWPEWKIYDAPVAELCGEHPAPAADWIVVLPVKRKGEGWWVTCPTGPTPVKDFLTAHPAQKDWLLKIETHDTWALDQLTEAVAPFLTTSNPLHIGAMSDSQKAMIYLRHKAPEWLFAADSASLLRLRMFESVWLESVFEFWPDFAIASSVADLDERGAAELARRQKRVVWRDGGAKPGFPVQGIITGQR